MNELAGYEMPPASLEAERAVLAVCLTCSGMDHVAVGDRALVAGSFYQSAHQKIYAACLDLWRDGQPVDLVSVSQHLKAKGWLDECGGKGYLSDIFSADGLLSNVEHYAGIVWGAAARRALIQRADAIRTWALDESLPLESLMKRAEETVVNVTARRAGGAASAPEVWTALVSALTDRPKAVPYRLPCMTYATQGGYRHGLFTLLGGKSGSGKTREMVANVHHLLMLGYGVLVFSFEMQRDDIGAIIATTHAHRCPSDLIVQGGSGGGDPFAFTAGASEFEAVGDMFKGPWNGKLWVFDASALTVEEMNAITRQYKAKHGISAVFVDFAGLIIGDGRGKNEEMEGIAKKLAWLYKANDVFGMVLTQVTEDGGKFRARYGRDFEHLSQTAYYIDRGNDQSLQGMSGIVKLRNEKNRYGIYSGHVLTVGWDPQLAQFVDRPQQENGHGEPEDEDPFGEDDGR